MLTFHHYARSGKPQMRQLQTIAREMSADGEYTDGDVLSCLRCGILTLTWPEKELQKAGNPNLPLLVERACFYLKQIGDLEILQIIRMNVTKVREIRSPELRAETLWLYRDRDSSAGQEAGEFYRENFLEPFWKTAESLETMRQSLAERTGCRIDWGEPFSRMAMAAKRVFTACGGTG